MRDPKEKAKEIYFAVLNEWKGFISEYLAGQLALLFVNTLNEQAEENFHAYGIGFMGSAIARNDYSKSKASKYWKDVKAEIKLMNGLK
jgi:hypothetical protein